MQLTVKGGYMVQVTNPDFSMIPNLEFVIARCLARIPRYAGHTNGNYTVAEHSVLVCRALRDDGHSALIQFIGLMHDATEAFVSDIPLPVKIRLIGIDTIENGFWNAICRYFGIDSYIPGIVKEFDQRICLNEAPHFFGPNVKFDIPADPLPNIRFSNMYERDAYSAFINEFIRLKAELSKGKSQ